MQRAGVKRYMLTPGCMGTAMLAVQVFGRDKVDAGSWLTPVYVFDITDEDASAGKDLLAEYGVSMDAAV